MAHLNSVREMFGQRKADAMTAYRKLVELFAGGKPAPANAVDVAIAAGRSVDDLESCATNLAERQQAAADLKTADGMADDLKRLETVEAKAAEALEATRKRHEQELQIAQTAYHNASGETRSTRNRQTILRERAIRVLNATCDPQIVGQIQQLEYQHGEVLRQRNELGRRLPARSMCVSANQTAGDAAYAKLLTDRQAELQRLEKLAIELGEQIEMLKQKKLDPMACAI